LKNESFKQLLEPSFTSKVLVIEHTTSKKCEETETSNSWSEEDSVFLFTKVQFIKRSLSNKALYLLYKVLRIIYVAFIFYFAPFIVILLSTVYPLFNRELTPITCA
jgi:hypothetical protein